MKVFKKFFKCLFVVDFDRVRALVKFKAMLFFFKSSRPCIGDILRDVGECHHNKLSY